MVYVLEIIYVEFDWIYICITDKKVIIYKLKIED